MAGPRFDAVGVVAKDMAATVAFYRRVGVGFPEGAESEEHVECALGSGMRLMIDSEDLIRGFHPGFTGDAGERVAFAARLDTPSEVDALYAELDADGYGVTAPWDAPWEMRYATVRDPDGVHVDLYAVEASDT
ncbi:MAG: VOC family protein [Geodermatophilaceae bacterium]